MSKQYSTFLASGILLTLTLMFGGCTPSARPATVPYNDQALYNYYLGKHYLGQGRLELARERFSLAQDAATDKQSRIRCAQELTIVNNMLRTRRLNSHEK